MSDPAEPEGTFPPELYRSLRRAATQHLRNQPQHTLQPTALVHEAVAKAIESAGGDWHRREDLFLFLCKVMRNALVDHARAKLADKRGGGRRKILLGDLEQPLYDAKADEAFATIAVHEALERLEAEHPDLHDIALARFIGRLTIEEAATFCKVSTRKVKMASAYFRKYMRDSLGEAE